MAVTFAVLASGQGTNFAAIADAVGRGDIPGAKVVGLITNRADAKALDRARERNIPNFLLTPPPVAPGGSVSESRKIYDEKLLHTLKELAPDFVLLAGYLRILSADVLRPYPFRVINIHPSLLPAFPGLHAVRQALQHGVSWTGVTVHFVTEDLDAGPILEQAAVEVYPHDNETSLYARIQPVEHATYVKALRRLCTEPYTIVEGRVVWEKKGLSGPR